MALAASPEFVLQGVNLSFSLYRTNGRRVSGWPKTAQSFFGIPRPSPSGCATRPFLTDPRAFYDPVDQRFWALISQTEGIPGLHPACDFASVVWVAVSSTSNPRGSWHVFAFDVSNGTGRWADFPGFGFNGEAVFVTANMFNTVGSFRYAEIMEANKALMEQGSSSFTPFFFTDLTVGGVSVDTVQPVQTGPSSSQPSAGFFESSYNAKGDPAGNNCFSELCRGVVIWAMTDPIAHDTGGPDPSLDFATVPTPKYAFPPPSSQPRCNHCIDAGNTSISATPVYRDGMIWAALTTALANGTAIVPGTLWLEIRASGPSLASSGYYAYAGKIGVTFPALMTDRAGNVTMVFDVSGKDIFPSARYARMPRSASGFPGVGRYLQRGAANTFDRRWGDYTAASFTGPGDNHVWFAAQYSAKDHDWATRIGEL